MKVEIETLARIRRDVSDLGVKQVAELLPERSGAERILAYLRLRVGESVHGDELAVVSGIQEYARRVREWRVEFGWPIVQNKRLYTLLRSEPDHEKAALWQALNEIRRKGLSARDRMLELFLRFPRQVITTAQLRYVTNGVDMRRVRELRTEFGWRIMTRGTGAPTLKPGEYILADEEPVAEHDRHIADEVIVSVLRRDNYGCKKCGWRPTQVIPGDPRQYIEVHHRLWHSEGGANTIDNLVTLCNVHHR